MAKEFTDSEMDNLLAQESLIVWSMQEVVASN